LGASAYVRRAEAADEFRMAVRPDGGAEKLVVQAQGGRALDASARQVVCWLAARQDAVAALCKPDVVQSAARSCVLAAHQAQSSPEVQPAAGAER
jgi:hypothetical protein